MPKKVNWVKVSEKLPKVFLGGTCNESNWRDKLILKMEINYFNPVVDDWNEEAQKTELRERETCDFCLYVVTPKMTGLYSIAEVIDDSNKRPQKTLFCYLEKDDEKTFDRHQKKSLQQVSEMVKRNGGTTFETLDEIAKYLNKQGKDSK